jgi:1-acyl-sn-glycerol-3-phosphate acyltransferase
MKPPTAEISPPRGGSPAADRRLPSSPLSRILRWAYDLVVTLALWGYFTIGFAVLFSPFYLAAAVFARNRQIAFQRLNHYFYRGFFLVLKALVPGITWSVDDRIAGLAGAVVVCNHRSYLDPLLLISLFRRHKTIVKHRLFGIPLFGWMLKSAGYIPSNARGALAEPMLGQIQALPAYLKHGGVLFVFPEGTRSRDGKLGAFTSGAFKLARRCGVPIAVLVVHHTEKLFRPGKFLFNTALRQGPRVRHLTTIAPDQYADWPLPELMDRVRQIMRSDEDHHGPVREPDPVDPNQETP